MQTREVQEIHTNPWTPTSNWVTQAKIGTQKRTIQALDSLSTKFLWFIVDPEEHRLIPRTDERWYTENCTKAWNVCYATDCIYYPWSILHDATEKLQYNIAQYWFHLPDEFFDYLTELVWKYDLLQWPNDNQWDPHKNWYAATLFSQIRAAQAYPDILKDPRSIKFYEALANL